MAATDNKWLFSREIDLSVFLGSAIVSLLLLAIGWRLGILNEESPDWTWISAVLLIDVAHVWSTSFRVYFDTEEFKRRFWLYLLVPVFGYAVGIALYSEGELTFWRALAIVAVFHFVDESLMEMKGRRPVVPHRERMAIVASVGIVDEVVTDVSRDKRVAWEHHPFDVLFKGDDWKGTAKGERLEQQMAEVGVRVVYLPYTPSTSSTMLRQLLSTYVTDNKVS